MAKRTKRSVRKKGKKANVILKKKPITLPTILAVAVGDNDAQHTLQSDPPYPFVVRPYINGLITELKKIGQIIGKHYQIDYRECPVNDLNNYAFGNFTAAVAFCMSARVVDHAWSLAHVRPIVGVISDPRNYLNAQRISGYSAQRVQTILACYNHFFYSVPSLKTVYVLHDKNHGPSNAALGTLPGTVKVIHVDSGIPKIPAELTKVWNHDKPDPHSTGILVLPVDRCFGDANDINSWGISNKVPIFWPVTDWVFATTTNTQPSALGGYGVSQSYSGEVMGAQVATILQGGTPNPQWIYANIDDPAADPDNTDIDWAVSQDAAVKTGTTLVNPPPAGLDVLLPPP
jgi:hypothetical protein